MVLSLINIYVELSQTDLQKMKNSLVIIGTIEQEKLEKDLVDVYKRQILQKVKAGKGMHV